MALSTSSCEVKPAQSAGLGVFTTRKLPTHSIALQDSSPLLAVLDSPRLTTTCSWCFFYAEEAAEDENIKLSACSGCKILRYCGKTCQTASWKHSHKHECKIFARLYPNILPNTARMAMQLLLRRQNGTLPTEEWEGFLRLQDHLDEFKMSAAHRGDGTFGNIQLMARAALEYSKSSEDQRLVETLVARILINSLTLSSPLYTPLGLILSLRFSRLNHSCAPNAIPTLSGRVLSLRTVVPTTGPPSSSSSSSSSTELTISYTDTNLPPAQRQHDLLSRYHFRCACPACAANLTLGRPDPGAAFAAIESEAASLLTEAAAAAAATATTTHSGKEATSPVATAKRQLVPLARALALFGSGSSRDGDGASFPAWRAPLARVRADLILALLGARRWVPALVQTLIARTVADPVEFPDEAHPVRVARGWVLARLAGQVGSCAAGAGTGAAGAEDDGDKGDKDGDDGDEGEAEAARALSLHFELDYSLVVWTLVVRVARCVSESHGADSRFGREVAREAHRLQDEGEKLGGWRPAPDAEKETWSRLERLSREGWDWWRNWEREKRRVRRRKEEEEEDGTKGESNGRKLLEHDDGDDGESPLDVDGIGILIGG